MTEIFHGCSECDHVLATGEECCPEHPDAMIHSVVGGDPEIISSEVWTGDQSNHYQRVERIGGHVLRTTVKHDAYELQSWARMERWSGDRWEIMHLFEGKQLTRKFGERTSYVSRKPLSEADFAATREELVRIACGILGVSK